jgi:hypothetical protein
VDVTALRLGLGRAAIVTTIGEGGSHDLFLMCFLGLLYHWEKKNKKQN